MKDKSSNALLNANKIGGGDVPPCIGVKSSALPEVQKFLLAVNSYTGVSTSNAPSATNQRLRSFRTFRKNYNFCINNGISL